MTPKTFKREVTIQRGYMDDSAAQLLKTAIVEQADAQELRCTAKVTYDNVLVTIDGADEAKVVAYEAALVSWANQRGF